MRVDIFTHMFSSYSFVPHCLLIQFSITSSSRQNKKKRGRIIEASLVSTAIFSLYHSNSNAQAITKRLYIATTNGAAEFQLGIQLTFVKFTEFIL